MKSILGKIQVINILRKILFNVQKIVLHISTFYHGIFKPTQSYSFSIGVDEIASFLTNTSNAFSQSHSTCLFSTSFYTNEYDVNLIGQGVINRWKRFILGPWYLGKLTFQTDNFLYVGREGFLITDIDEREFEFSYLKKLQKEIIILFLGSDIRSNKLQDIFCTENNIELISTYQKYLIYNSDSQNIEDKKKNRAIVSDKYASIVCTPEVDQINYLQKDSFPLPYFYPDNAFNLNYEKWNDKEIPLEVLHCPSAPVIKGTQLVRAAVKKLKSIGYKFNYIELKDVSHEVVLNKLASAHIVLNEFYAQVPGVFGVEAMANNCALLTSADPKIEPTLPNGADKAWVVTPSYDVFDCLKRLLDSPRDDIIRQAQQGYDFTKKYWSATNSADAIFQRLNQDNADKKVN